MNQQKIHQTVHHVLELLANREYAALEQLTGGNLLNQKEIQDALDLYPYRPIMPPPDQIESLLDIVAVREEHDRYSSGQTFGLSRKDDPT